MNPHIAHNLRVTEDLCSTLGLVPGTAAFIERLRGRDANGHLCGSRLVCVNCGTSLTYGNVRYFHDDVQRVTCHQCQDKSRIPTN